MATKTILEKEQLDLLLSTYKEVGTFAAAGRAVGISGAVAKRIIGEHMNFEESKVETVTEYSGPPVPEMVEIESNFKKMFSVLNNEEWWSKYNE